MPLNRRHEVAEFQCRSPEQTLWLRNHALQSAGSGVARTFVVTGEDSETRVVAYYAWTMAAVSLESTPGRFQRGVGAYPQPVALLARLGVDARNEGQGLGAAMLLDVASRLVSISAEIGCRGLLVHCETAAARSFYEHLLPEFVRSPTDELHLYLLMKDARTALAR